MEQRFEARLVKPDAVGSWTYLTVPFDVEDVFGSKGQVKVSGTVNGIPFRSSLMPHGNGTHYMVVGKATRDAAGVIHGSRVEVIMELDVEQRTVNLPQPFQEALESHALAKESFDRLSYSHRKEYVEWIEQAKKTETQLKRVEKAVMMLAEGRKLK